MYVQFLRHISNANKIGFINIISTFHFVDSWSRFTEVVINIFSARRSYEFSESVMRTSGAKSFFCHLVKKLSLPEVCFLVQTSIQVCFRTSRTSEHFQFNLTELWKQPRPPCHTSTMPVALTTIVSIRWPVQPPGRKIVAWVGRRHDGNQKLNYENWWGSKRKTCQEEKRELKGKSDHLKTKENIYTRRRDYEGFRRPWWETQEPNGTGKNTQVHKAWIQERSSLKKEEKRTDTAELSLLNINFLG